MSSFRFIVVACVFVVSATLAACAGEGVSSQDGDFQGDGDNDEDGSGSTTCSKNEDCGRGYYCDDGTCRDADCDDDHPCRIGYRCVDYICIPEETPDDDEAQNCPDGTVWSVEQQKCVSADGDIEDGDDEPLPVICEAETVICHGNVLDTCSQDGTRWDGNECQSGTVCLIDTCISKVCNPLQVGTCASEFFVNKCNPYGTGWEEEMCPDHFACLSGQGCKPITCSSGVALGCLDNNTVKICSDEGNDYYTENCPEDTTCYGDGCQPFICQAGNWKCEGDELYYCNPLGTAWDLVMDCEVADSICADGTCIDQICTPGARTCMEGSVQGIKECNENGSAWVDMTTCGDKQECREAQCLGLCEVAEIEKGYVGCHYWPVDLENSGRDSGGQFAVIVSNPQSFNVNVTVSNNTQLLSTHQLAPGELKTIQLGSTQRLTGPTKSFKAYHVESDAPVTVAQMNPYGNVLIYSNDASLLLPQSAMSNEYYGLTWPTWRWEDCYCSGIIIIGCIGSWKCDEVKTSPGTLTVVATESGITNVTVDYSCATLGGGGVTAASAGATQSYSLQQYEVLNLVSAGTDCPNVNDETYIFCSGPDLSGTKIVADQKIAVYGGHRGTFIPHNQWAADHIEHQLFPIDTWGKKYSVVRTQPRGSEQDYYKIVAGINNTRVEFSPDPTGQSPKILNAGQVFTFSTTSTFSITSDQPIMVGHFLAGQDATGFSLGNSCTFDSDCPAKYICCADCGYACSPEAGDPAMMLLAPDQQFRQNYIFQVPPNYKYDYMTLVAPPDTIITLDNTSTYDSNSFTWINVNNKYYRTQISDGAHTLSATKPIGLYLYGYSAFVSYAYTGGLDLKTINPKP